MTDTRSGAAALRTAATAALAAAALLLAGCGALPAGPGASSPSQTQPAGEQTQAQQCAAVMAEAQSIATDLGRVGELLGTDPLQALALVSGISGRVGDLQTRVTDPALLERIGEIQAGWDALVEDAQTSLAAGDPAGIERVAGALTTLGEQVASLQEFCAGTA